MKPVGRRLTQEQQTLAERNALLANPSTTLDELMNVLIRIHGNGYEERLVEAVINHPNMTEAAIIFMFASAEHNIEPTTVAEFLDTVSDALFSYILEEQEDAAAFLSFRNDLTTDRFELLAKHRSPDTRNVLASNQLLPFELFELLALDRELRVRLSVLTSPYIENEMREEMLMSDAPLEPMSLDRSSLEMHYLSGNACLIEFQDYLTEKMETFKSDNALEDCPDSFVIAALWGADVPKHSLRSIMRPHIRPFRE